MFHSPWKFALLRSLKKKALRLSTLRGSLSLSLSARDDPEATRIDDYASDRRRQVNLAAIFNADARVINIEASTLNTRARARARKNECRINCGRHRMKSRGLFELASGDDTRHAIPELTQRKYR